MILNDLGVNKALLIFVLFTLTTLVSLSSAAAEMTNDRIIVKYRAADKAPKSIGIASKAMPGALKQVQMLSNDSAVYATAESMTAAELDVIVADLNSNADVEFAERDLVLHTNFVPNDARFADQWHLQDAVAGLQMASVWDDFTGAGVVVAVIDSGIIRHQDLTANLLPGYDMISKTSHSQDGNGRDSDPTDMGDEDDTTTDVWHGTHVAGTIAAVANNNKGTAGVAFGAKVVPVRAVGVNGGYLSDIADSIVWAAGGNVPGVPTNQNPAKVINLSVGGQGAGGHTIQSAIDTAYALGATIVVSAGNDQMDVSNVVPASCNRVVTVGAINRSGAQAYYSNYGAGVSLSAAGGEIVSSYGDGILSSWGDHGYSYLEGTSMAAPQVAAVAALLYQANPELTPAEVMNVLTSSARPFTAECDQCGAGIVNPAAALALVKPAVAVADTSLGNGVIADAIDLQAGVAAYYTITLPADAAELDVTLSGVSGDADLYVAFEQRPTLSHYDCRSDNDQSAELCHLEVAQEGTYYIMVYAHSAATSVALHASFTLQTPKTATPATSATPAAAAAAANTATNSNTGAGGGGSMLWSVLFLALVLVARTPRAVK